MAVRYSVSLLFKITISSKMKIFSISLFENVNIYKDM
jgi:hypothetical protein